MGGSEFTSVNPRLMQTILRHLESLRRNIDGDELYGMIARILRRHGRNGPIGNACFAELHYRLDVYANDPVALPATRIKARLLQQHIAPYLPDDARQQPPIETPAAEDVTEVEFHTTAAPTPVPVTTSTDINPEPVKEGTLGTRPSTLEERRQRYQALQRSEKDAWRAIYGVVKDFSSLKTLWSSSFNDMAQERQRLQQKLADTEQSLQSVEDSCRQLRTDLKSVQRAPARKPARRLTRARRGAAPRLVSREVFLQQLQAEVSRVKRGGGSVALAMLGVEDLEAIAHEHGDGADAAVLRCYVREILSGFRVYDVVGQYSDDVFAVLLPDTEQEGAARALEKAQKRAAETHVSHDSRRFPLPRFRGGLTVYVPGEEPALWLQRTESVIDEARRQKSEQPVAS